MANVTIPNLTSATTIAPSTDLMVLEQTEGTRKATLSQIFTSSATSGSGLGITSGGVYTIKTGLDSNISDINTFLGNTSIASIGDGTVTGALSTISANLFEYRGAVPSGDLQTETLSSGSDYIYVLTGSDALCGVVIIRTTSSGAVNHSSVPSAVSVTLGTNYIKFHNNSTGNTMQIFRLTLHR